VISYISKYGGQQEFLLPKGLKTHITNVRVEKIDFDGKPYEVIRIFETID
jgi:hypothetical protein